MSEQEVVAIGADHAGFAYKELIKAHLEQRGFSVRDFGTKSEESTDYPDHVHPLAQAIDSGEISRGILVCGSGNGVCMTANKYASVRAALAWEPEIAALARQHNNANVVCLPARFLSTHRAIQLADIFMDTEFEGGRHQRRVSKIDPSHS